MEVPATVKTVLPELDVATRTRSVVLSLDQVGSVSVVPGQIARVTLRDRVPMAGFWLPTTALSRGNRGLWSALVVESDESGSSIAARRDVEVLHTEGDRVLVRGTLDERDVVITSGVHRLAPGQPVEMTEVVASTPLGSAE